MKYLPIIFLMFLGGLFAADTGVPHDTCNPWEIHDNTNSLCHPCFLRGDANGDHVIDVSDPTAILDYLFNGIDHICKEPSDVDDNDVLNITDPIVLLNFLFSGGPPPGGGHHIWPQDERSCWCVSGGQFFCCTPL